MEGRRPCQSASHRSAHAYPGKLLREPFDGRPHPDEFAAHTWQGFSTGTWEGQTLKVVTTHLKKGWIRRNGVPRSDQAELTEYFYRHGEFMTWTVIINDPLYLTEPMIRTSDYRLAPTQNVGPYPCLIVEEIDYHQACLRTGCREKS
jgi:hypothetical protein